MSGLDDIAIGGTTQDDIAEDVASEEHVRIGQSEYNLVGIRYYRGVAHPGEFIKIVREPNNPYDRNAIRIDNLRNEKVGHIKREQAAMLSRLIDDTTISNLKMEGSIPRAGNKFQLPLQIVFYSVSQSNESVEELASKLGSVLQTRLRQDYRFRLESNFDASIQATKVAASQQPVPVVHSKKLDWDAQAKELDEMFDKQCEMQTMNLTDIPMPIQFSSDLQLFDYQKTGIRWMVHQEIYSKEVPFFEQVKETGKKMWLCRLTNSSQEEEPKLVRGGILADEMGLGKTIQTIGLILAAPPNGHLYKSSESEVRMMPSKKKIEKEKSAVLKQILKAAGLKQSGKKGDQIDRIIAGINSDIVLIDHFPPEMTAPPVLPGVSGSGFTTLIVCPVSVISNWQHQINTHVKEGVLRVDVFQGPSRDLLIPDIKENRIDVLLVSYHTLASEFKSMKAKSQDDEPDLKRTRKESIFDLSFHRIVLDEAHSIRSNKTSFFKAVTAIKADRKLALTGTPFVNRADDIQSLLSFLQVEPLASSDIFRRSISQQIKEGHEIGLTRLRTIVSHIALRRSKAVANIKLVNKEVILRSVEFPSDDSNKKVYDAFFGTFRAAMEAILDDVNMTGEVTKSYHSVLEVLLRMRQSCCSASMIPEDRRQSIVDTWNSLKENKNGVKLTVDEAQSLLEKVKGAFSHEDEMPECAVCFDEMNINECRILKTCKHIFCQKCIQRVMGTSVNRNCPLCRTPFQALDLVQKAMAENRVKSNVKISSDTSCDSTNNTPPKVVALLDAIKEMQVDEKGVIFSQFTKFLSIIELGLESVGIKFVRIDGTMTAKKRLEAMTLFDSDEADSPQFILCSLRAAGVGINLTRGSYVFMMDSWWNEATENQAMDRVHRIGQRRDVKVFRFVMKDSIEERMVSIQRMKSMQAKGAMQKLTKEELKASRMSELKSLLMLDGKSEKD